MASNKMERTQPLTVKEAQTKKIPERLKKCRYCTNDVNTSRYYKSQDFLDTDGKMSICIKCCTYLFNEFYAVHSRIDIAIYEVCRCVNVRYDSKSYSALMTSLEKNSMQDKINAINMDYVEEVDDKSIDEIAVNTKTSIFGKYYSILQKVYANSKIDLMFDVYKNDRPEGYEDKSSDKPVTEVLNEEYGKKLSLLEKKWGKYEDEDYSILESEYNSWGKNKDLEEKGTDTLIKEICKHQLKMNKIRESGEDIKKVDIDILTSLMDKCSLTPDKIKESASNRSVASWGAWLKDIETMSPAEWVENKKLFKDVEGIDRYVDSTFNRSLKNYIGMHRDFRVVMDAMDKEAEDFDVADITGIDMSEETDEGEQ